jgi:fermentation-respiration switch protein FrsA (DUF1100 family)
MIVSAKVRGTGGALVRRGLFTLAVVAVVAAGVSCGGGDGNSEGESGAAGSDGDGRAAPAAEGPFTVEALTETFVDESRPTDDPSGVRAAPTRTLVTDIYVPDGEGPFPLVVHAHGFNGNPGKFVQLFTRWAEAGYVVVAPRFPMTNDIDAGTGVLGDYVNQPADVSFVIDEVLALVDGDHPVLGGRVDESRIGLSGHSLGGATAYGLVFHDCCRDDRIDAVTLMSTLPLPFGDSDFHFDDGSPVLLLQLTGDPIVPYDEAVQTYEAASRPKYLVTLEDTGHFEPYEDFPSDHDELVGSVTTVFWDAYLRDRRDAPDELVATAEGANLTSITADP